MSNTINFEKAFQIPSDEFFLLCGTAIEGLKKGKITSADPVMGEIEGVFGGSLWNGGGSGIRIEIIPSSQEDCILVLEVYPLNGYGKKTPFGLGKNPQKGFSEFMEELDIRVKRFQVKYGLSEIT